MSVETTIWVFIFVEQFCIFSILIHILDHGKSTTSVNHSIALNFFARYLVNDFRSSIVEFINWLSSRLRIASVFISHRSFIEGNFAITVLIKSSEREIKYFFPLPFRPIDSQQEIFFKEKNLTSFLDWRG